MHHRFWQKHPNVFFISTIFPIYFRERGDIVEKRYIAGSC